MDKTILLTDSNFDEVLQTDKPVLVDIWAEWCGPCKMLDRVVNEVADDYAGKVLIGKLNADENPLTIARFAVRSVPTLLIFGNGIVVDKQVGVVPKSVLSKKLEAQLSLEVFSE